MMNRLSLLLSLLAVPVAQAVDFPAATDIISSSDGVLDVTLTVSEVVSLNGSRIAPGYNGKPVGPTLVANPGDKVKITLVNDLPPASASSRKLYDYVLDEEAFLEDPNAQTIIYNRLLPPGIPQFAPRESYWGHEFMNLHFHGLMVDPALENNRDVAIDGGESLTYEFTLPEDAQPGFTWYHNHYHGTAAYSSLSGLNGVFLVSGENDPYKAIADDDSASEVVLVVSESYTYEDGTPQNFIPIAMSFDWETVTNGEINPTITFQRGETAYFRMVNAGERPDVILSIDGHSMMPISMDRGYPTPDAGTEVNTLTIGAGARADFKVVFDTPGTYVMRRGPWNLGVAGPGCNALFGIPVDTCVSYDKETIVATIVVTDDMVAKPAKRTIANVVPGLTEAFDALLDQPMVGSKTVEFDLTGPGDLLQLTPLIATLNGTCPGPCSTVGMNKQVGNANVILGEFTGGTCEEITVYSNPPGLVPHTFHVHSVPMLVTSVDGVVVDEPFWRDTFPVAQNMTATVCFPPQEEEALVSIHCHFPAHQDTGMAGYYRLLPGGDTDSSATAGDDIDSSAMASNTGRMIAIVTAAVLCFLL